MSPGNTAALASALFVLVLVWVACRFPRALRDRPGYEGSWLERHARYACSDELLLYLLLWTPVMLAIYSPLHFLALWRAQSMHPSAGTLVFYADEPLLFPAFFLALVLAIPLAVLVQRVIFQNPDDFELLVTPPYRGLRVFAVGTCAMSLLAEFGLFGTYITATPDTLVVNPLFGFERRYDYSDIATIETAPLIIAPSGNQVWRRSFLVKFRDGTTLWSGHIFVEEFFGRTREDLLRTIVERSKQQPAELEYFDFHPHL